MAKSLRDLQKLTGRGRDTCIAAIESGQAPGYRMGNGWVIPDEAFELFSRGYWEPVAARVTPIQPKQPLVRKVNPSEAVSTDSEGETP